MASEIRLNIRRSAFRCASEMSALQHSPGKGLGYYLDDLDYTVPPGCNAVVMVQSDGEGQTLEPEEWDNFVPTAGDLIVVNTLPGKGGGGGKSPFQTLTSIASLALMFAAPTAGPLAFLSASPIAAFPKLTWGAVAGFGLNMVSGLMTQPPKPSLSALGQVGGGMAPSSPTYKIDDAGNQELPYGKVPRPVGKYSWTPPRGAKAYREVIGKKLYYRILLVPGYGPLKISDIGLGETPIAEFGDAIKVEIREGWDTDAPLTLFSNDVHEEQMDVLLTNAAGWSSRTTLSNVDEISLDIMFPRLANITGSSSRSALTVTTEVEYSPSGQNNWLPCPWETDGYPGLEVAGKITVTDNSTSEVWRGARFKVAQGQYDVRFRRTTADQTDNNKLDQVHWVALRSIRYADPVAAKGIAKVALRVEATNELQGALQPVRFTTEAYQNVYDPATGVWSMQISRSPAWAAVDALMNQNHNPRPKTAAQMDLDTFSTWAADCTARGLNCDGVLDYGATVMSVFNDIAETGWGRFDMNGTLFSVVWDRPIAAPSQHFTPHNTISFSREKLFPKRPHALHCHFINAAKGYQRDMLAVHAPGYDATTATMFEVREYHLIVDVPQVKVTALREIGVSIYRDMKCELTCKMEHLVVRPGQLISATRPETGWGLGSGRVKSATVNDANLTDGVPMLAAKAYSIAFRYKNQTRKIFDLLPKGQDGEYTTVEFAAPDGQGGWVATPIAAGNVPNPEDMFQFGETNFVGKNFLVDKIDHARGDQATLYLAPAGSEIFTFINGTQPPYDSKLSSIPDVYRRPAQPVILSVASDEAVMAPVAGGGWQPRIVVSLATRGGGDFRLNHLTARIRRSDASQWQELPLLAAGATEVAFTDVQQAVKYDMDFMVVTDAGISSPRAAISNHTVVGKSSPALDPDGLYVEKLPNNRFRYRVVGKTAVDHGGWLFRWNPGVNLNWEPAVAAHLGVHKTDTFESTAFIARTFTVLCKAVDDSGNPSNGLVYAVVRLGDRITDNLVDSVDYAGQGFPGTITGGVISGGELQSTSSAALFNDPVQPLFIDPNAALYSGYETLIYEGLLRPNNTGFLNIDHNFDGPALIDYRAAGTEPLFIDPNRPLFTDPNQALYPQGLYIAYHGPFEVVAGTDYSIRVTIPGGPLRGTIRALAANIEVRTETETLNDIVINSTGTRILPTRLWDKIVKMDFTVQETPGSVAVRAAYLDLLATGPMVKVYDNNNTATNGVIDVTIQGMLLPAI